MLALLGPSSRKRKRTGTGTSSTASSSTASRSRTKAMVGRERNSTQPGEWGHREQEKDAGYLLAPSPGAAPRQAGCQDPLPQDLSHIPTRTTVASAFSGIFSSSFSSCLDLERVMPAGGAGGGNSRWGCRTELRLACSESCSQLWWPGLTKAGPPSPLTSRSTSSRVSGMPPMRGSVTWGSLSAPWPW